MRGDWEKVERRLREEVDRLCVRVLIERRRLKEG